LVADEEFGPISWLRTFLLIEVLIDRGAMVDARLEATKMIEAGRARQNPLQEGRARAALADLLCRCGDLGPAEDQAHAALPLLSTLPLDHLAATATLAAIRLARGGIGEALTAAEQVLSRYETLRAFGFKGAFARLIRAEALRAAGSAERARAAITDARDRLLANAAKIGDPAYQKTFLENGPENARTLALARAWLGEGEGEDARRAKTP
jgi:eukaryotic-like serine/threonine-protein kinase